MNNIQGNNVTLNSDISYITGLILSDGHLRKDCNIVQLELQRKDKSLLEKVSRIIESNFNAKCKLTDGIRDTNKKSGYEFSRLVISSKDFMELLVAIGLPRGKKSSIITSPNCSFQDIDLIRGFIDGDGSICFTKGNPYVSITTSSKAFHSYYCNFLYEKLTVRKRGGLDSRKTFNPSVSREDAVKLCQLVYYDQCLSLDRKYNLARQVINWKRDPNCKRIQGQTYWTKEEDNIILSYPVKEVTKLLKRSRGSVTARKNDLLKNPNNFANCKFLLKPWTKEEDEIVLSFRNKEAAKLLNRTYGAITRRKGNLLSKET